MLEKMKHLFLSKNYVTALDKKNIILFGISNKRFAMLVVLSLYYLRAYFRPKGDLNHDQFFLLKC